MGGEAGGVCPRHGRHRATVCGGRVLAVPVCEGGAVIWMEVTDQVAGSVPICEELGRRASLCSAAACEETVLVLAAALCGGITNLAF